MSTVNFRIRNHENKEVSIYVYLSAGRGKMYQCKSGFTINPKNWSGTSGRPKQNSEASKAIFNALKKLESYVHSELNIDNVKGVEINTDWLALKVKECFNRVEKTDSTIVCNHFQEFIRTAPTRRVSRKKVGLSPGRVNVLNTSLKIFEEYEKSLRRRIHFTDISKSFVEKFKDWLLETKRYSVNHAGKQLANLKTIALDAKKLDIPTHSYIENIESFSEAEEDRHIVTLSFEEIDKIRNTNLKLPALINARQWLLIGCLIGQRGGDLLDLTEADIKVEKGLKKFDIRQKKGGKYVTVPVSEELELILKDGFPYIISMQRFNEYIKLVCKAAGIDDPTEGRKKDPETDRSILGIYPKYELVTSHCCRRSFATNYYYKNIPIHVLMKITGHSRESVFRAYINVPEDKDDDARVMLKYLETISK
ncbi:MAG: tyrosine-type recombinase/integrase [Flavobacteriales bacterium]